MKFYAKAFDILQKNWMIAIPLLVAYLIPAFFMIGATANVFASIGQIQGLIGSLNSNADPMSMIQALSSTLMLVLAPMMAAYSVQALLVFLTTPITYGLANSVTTGEKVGFESYLPMLAKFIVPYLIFCVAGIVICVIAGIALTIVFLILGLILGLLGVIGGILMVIIYIAVCVLAVIITLKLSFWFIIMVNEGASVVDALKKSLEATNGVTLTILGISLLNGLLFGVAGAILGMIPFLGVLIGGLLSGAAAVLMIVFLFVLYLNKTGKVVIE